MAEKQISYELSSHMQLRQGKDLSQKSSTVPGKQQTLNIWIHLKHNHA